MYLENPHGLYRKSLWIYITKLLKTMTAPSIYSRSSIYFCFIPALTKLGIYMMPDINTRPAINRGNTVH